MVKIVLGTRNPAKLSEMLRILGDIPGIIWVDFRALPFPEPQEDGVTFRANAEHKAREICCHTGLPALAEDSGLEVEALGGAPGVLSARFAGLEKDSNANTQLLLRKLHGSTNRRAQFTSFAVLAHPDGRRWQGEGVLQGAITSEPRGTGGFGYDPVFIPLGEQRTLADMLPEEKDAISHRRRALEALRSVIVELAARG